jgi:hypothetical protein
MGKKTKWTKWSKKEKYLYLLRTNIVTMSLVKIWVREDLFWYLVSLKPIEHVHSFDKLLRKKLTGDANAKLD